MHLCYTSSPLAFNLLQFRLFSVGLVCEADSSSCAQPKANQFVCPGLLKGLGTPGSYFTWISCDISSLKVKRIVLCSFFRCFLIVPGGSDISCGFLHPKQQRPNFCV